MQEMINRAKELLSDGTVNRVLGWRRGDMSYNPEPSYFETAEDLDANFVYNGFCGANLSKYMIEGSKLEGKTLVFLKPCDSYSFNQLIAEHRVDRDKAYIIGVGCMGKLSFEKIKEQGVKGITNITIDDANENITGRRSTVKRRSPIRTACWSAAMSARARSTRFSTRPSAKAATQRTQTALQRSRRSKP